MRTRAVPAAAPQRAVQPSASSRFPCGSRRRGGARNVLILRIGAVMSNSLCSNELVGSSAVAASTKVGRIAVACGSRALPQVLRARNAPSATTRNARRHQSVTHAPTRHGTCYAGPLGYEQSCVLVSLVLRLRPALGQVHRDPGIGLHPSPGRLGGLGGRGRPRPRATAGQAAVLVSRLRRALCALVRSERLLVDGSGSDGRPVPDLPSASRARVADLGDRVVAGTPAGAAPSIRP